ncbi:MAG TPA: hypothetical protein VN961_17035 [Streptosporangiaceae bacterium]|nr:hypothetical protein [Streptosporangiaceae bacterium]
MSTRRFTWQAMVALGAADRVRRLGDRGGALEEQVQEGTAQRIGQRAQLPGRVTTTISSRS